MFNGISNVINVVRVLIVVFCTLKKAINNNLPGYSFYINIKVFFLFMFN